MDFARNLRGFCVGIISFFCLNVNAKDINVSLPVLYTLYTGRVVTIHMEKS